MRVNLEKWVKLEARAARGRSCARPAAFSLVNKTRFYRSQVCAIGVALFPNGTVNVRSRWRRVTQSKVNACARTRASFGSQCVSVRERHFTQVHVLPRVDAERMSACGLV